MTEESNRPPVYSNRFQEITEARRLELERLARCSDPFPNALSARPFTEYERVLILDDVMAKLAEGWAMQLICSQPEMPSYQTVMSWLAADPEQEKRYDALKPARARAYFELAVWEVQRARDPEAMKIAEKRANLYLKAAALLNPTVYSDKTHTQLGKSGASQPVHITLNIGQTSEVHKGEITAIGSDIP